VAAVARANNAGRTCHLRRFDVLIQFRNKSEAIYRIYVMRTRSSLSKVWHLILLQGVIYGIAGGCLYMPIMIWVRNARSVLPQPL
jgi:hypothetical protein